MYREEDFLQISGIQHFSFCRRQWALIHIEQQWEENVLTAEGRQEHSRVHDEKIQDIRDGVITKRGLRIYSNELGIHGVCDAVEFIPANDGIQLFGKDGCWIPRPVEYKHGTKKINDCDRLQVVLQAMCLSEMFSFEVEEGCIFYHKNRSREYIAITDELRQEATKMINEMHSYMTRGYTPKVKPAKACRQCSLIDICVPELLTADSEVSEYIARHIEDTGYEKDA